MAPLITSAGRYPTKPVRGRPRQEASCFLPCSKKHVRRSQTRAPVPSGMPDTESAANRARVATAVKVPLTGRGQRGQAQKPRPVKGPGVRVILATKPQPCSGLQRPASVSGRQGPRRLPVRAPTGERASSARAARLRRFAALRTAQAGGRPLHGRAASRDGPAHHARGRQASVQVAQTVQSTSGWLQQV